MKLSYSENEHQGWGLKKTQNLKWVWKNSPKANMLKINTRRAMIMMKRKFIFEVDVIFLYSNSYNKENINEENEDLMDNESEN